MNEDNIPEVTALDGSEPAEFHFDLKTAREVVPWLRLRVKEMDELGREGKIAMAAYDMEAAEELTVRIQEILNEIHRKGVEIKDPSSVLFDFPAIINNMPAYLCWKLDEEDVEYWHYVDEGFAGRKKIDGTEQILSSL